MDRESAPGGLLAGKPRVAMFCTGGIRCEKSTALMRMKGFDEVYHLEGGIPKYLETVPEAASSWQGECFVFDERVSVGHALVPGDYALCLACGHPVSADERANALFEHGGAARTATPTPPRRAVPSFASDDASRRLRRPTSGRRRVSAAEAPMLYSFRRCPYAMRARLAIAVSGVQVTLREVVLRDKPAALREASPRPRCRCWFCRWHGDRREPEIMLWALGQNDPAGWLTPDSGSLPDMLTLIGHNDAPGEGGFKHHLDRYKYPQRYPGTQLLAHRAEARRFARRTPAAHGEPVRQPHVVCRHGHRAIREAVCRHRCAVVRDPEVARPERLAVAFYRIAAVLALHAQYAAWQPDKLPQRFPAD